MASLKEAMEKLIKYYPSQKPYGVRYFANKLNMGTPLSVKAFINKANHFFLPLNPIRIILTPKFPPVPVNSSQQDDSNTYCFTSGTVYLPGAYMKQLEIIGVKSLSDEGFNLWYNEFNTKKVPDDLVGVRMSNINATTDRFNGLSCQGNFEAIRDMPAYLVKDDPNKIDKIILNVYWKEK